MSKDLTKYRPKSRQNAYVTTRRKFLQDYRIAINELFGNEIDFVGKSLHDGFMDEHL